MVVWIICLFMVYVLCMCRISLRGWIKYLSVYQRLIETVLEYLMRQVCPVYLSTWMTSLSILSQCHSISRTSIGSGIMSMKGDWPSTQRNPDSVNRKYNSWATLLIDQEFQLILTKSMPSSHIQYQLQYQCAEKERKQIHPESKVPKCFWPAEKKTASSSHSVLSQSQFTIHPLYRCKWDRARSCSHSVKGWKYGGSTCQLNMDSSWKKLFCHRKMANWQHYLEHYLEPKMFTIVTNCSAQNRVKV